MKTLLATVGSNPLPVAVVVRHLCPQRVILLYTADVQQVVERVAYHLRRTLASCEIPPPFQIRNFQTATGIGDDLANAPKDWPQTEEEWAETGLAYTGGTKLMAVHVHTYWREKGGRPEHGGYLGPDGKLYFDGGRWIPESDLPALSFEEQCLLHLGQEPQPPTNGHRNPESRELAAAIQRCLTANCWQNYKDELNKMRTVDAEVVSNRLGIERGLIEKQENPKKFLEGGWLEVWLASQLAAMRDESGQPLFDDVVQSVRVEQNPDFEIDVVATRGYRVFFFSCAAKGGDKDVKWKFFEALHRSARVGGEHARAAVVCLHEDPARMLRTVQAEHWPGYDTVRLFGKAHVTGGQAVCHLIRSAGGREASQPVTLEQGIKDWVLRP
jgi:hypothetical protein